MSFFLFKRKHWYQWVLLFVLFFPLCNTASDIEIEKATRNLTQLKQEIQKLQIVISKENSKKKALVTNLNRHQQQLNVLHRRISNLTVRYQQHEAQHKQLQTRYQHHNAQLKLSYEELTALLKTLYCLSYRPDATIAQAYGYYFYQSQQDQLAQLREQLEALYQKLYQVEKHKKTAQTDLSQQKRHHAQLQRKIQLYNNQLSQSQARLKARENRLQQLNKNKAALDKLVEDLMQSQLKTTISSLIQCKGKLSWPVQGSLIQRYNELIEQSELRSTGVFIKVKAKQVVQSVASGKVVFADQLRGLGALIVVEHGQGDLSLYGHNAQLLKKKGDMVKPNEALAVATSHIENNKVYFELRLAGKAVDPELWCIKR